MALEGHLIEREGVLYVGYETTLDYEPVRLRYYWRVVSTTGNPWHGSRPAAGDRCRYNGHEVWSTSREEGGSTGSVRQKEGAADYIEREPVPAPKVRRGVELRWREGRWQKLLKKGWVAA